MARKKKDDDAPIAIKKYANRRLYNTATSSYVTLDHLCQMVKDGVDFEVFDAKTGEDITRSVLTQIIFEEEGKLQQGLLPTSFLRTLIQFYGDNLQNVLPSYLTMSIENFQRNREKMEQDLREAIGAKLPFRDFEEQIRQNLAGFENAVRSLSPFSRLRSKENEAEEVEEEDLDDGSEETDELEALKEQLEAMQKQLNKLSK